MRTVVIYGNSLVVSSIGASLSGCPDMKVLSVDPAAPNAEEQLSAAQPDVIIFDLLVNQADFSIHLWKRRPQLLLIGVDLSRGQALVLSNQPARMFTTADLLDVIESNTGAATHQK
jgi:hypothetical protein